MVMKKAVVLHGDSSLLVRVMSESSITESNKEAEKFGRPQLGHSQAHEDLFNTERRLTSMLMQTAWYHALLCIRAYWSVG